MSLIMQMTTGSDVKMQYLELMSEADGAGILSAKTGINNQFEALFNYATIGIVVTDHLGIIVNFNKYAENQFSYSKEEVVGNTVEMLIPAKLHDKHIGHRKGFYKHPEPRRMGEGRDLFALKKNGVEFPVEVSLSHYTFGEETYVIAFVIDITIRKRGEAIVLQQKSDLEKVTDDIRQLNAQLEQKVDDRTIMLRETLAELEKSREELSIALVAERELSDLKYRFVTTASHEFRTPLSTILSSAYLLGKYNHTEYEGKKNRHITRIKNAVEGMKGILEDFLSLGKLEEGKVSAKIVEWEVVKLMEDLQLTVLEMEHLLKAGQKIQLSHDFQLGSVFTDNHMLKNILINLLSNAIKFSEENTVIELGVLLTPAVFSLSVRDRGIGIPLEDQQHLFERFFRAGNASNIQGTGLGLHIISKYLELLNGTIQIESIDGEGSCFTVNFPNTLIHSVV
jgi:PAS domain S-box-containing protein